MTRRAATAGAVYVVEFRGHLTPLNRLVGCHWGTAQRRKKADKAVVALACKLAGVPPAVTRRRVSLVVTLAPRQRAPDSDAWFKSLLDALTACHAVKDDNPVWCELGPVTYARGPARRTTITLEDLPRG
jgi:Holliday junction resolvase RusA-like endonuclease